MKKREFLKSLIVGISVLAIPDALSTQKNKNLTPKGPKSTNNIRLFGMYDYTSDNLHLRVRVERLDDIGFNDAIEIKGNAIRHNPRESVEEVTACVNMILDNGWIEKRATKEMVVDAFSHVHGNYLLDMVS